MDRFQQFAAPQSRLLRKYCRCTWLVALLLFAVIASVGITNAQSKDQDHPTPITSTVISGEPISPDSNGLNYYYSFVANRGDVTITLTAEASRDLVQVGFDLFDEKEVRLVHAAATTIVSSFSTHTTTGEAVRTVTVKHRQRMVLRISILGAGFGKYRLRLSGSVDLAQGVDEKATPTIGGLNASNQVGQPKHIDCLTKHGTLIVKMKDGSKKIIDLSDADTVTIVP